MRQVPADTSYLLIGDGRVARHLAYYFDLENISYRRWTRQESLETLIDRSQSCSHVLLLISDSAIEAFLQNAPFLRGKTCVHMSGALVTELASGAHPLMTFGPDLYELDEYRRIPFICEKGRLGFAQTLPGLSNPHFAIEPEMKPLYHALCVISGNFTTLLWQKAFRDFEAKLALPSSVLIPYLERTAKNLAKPNAAQALTGPLARGDQETMTRNLAALSGDPFQNVYQAFKNAFGTSSGESTHEIHS